MASAVVLVFLLDYLPGYNVVLNKTLPDKIASTKTYQNFTIGPCDTVAIQAIMKSLRRASDLKTKRNISDEINTNGISQEWSAETLINLGTVLDMSLPEIENDSKNNNTGLKSDDPDCVNQDKKESVNNVFPESAPFSVAIFESVSNVTAQTCAGTLMSPHWVLTAASCVNMLGHFYKNVTSKSIYTVVVNATDSLTDGIAYNVTTVLLHPEYKHYRNKRLATFMVPVPHEKAHLALMRIEPAVEGARDMVVDDVGPGADVRVYGWMLVKNATGNNSMHATSVPAKTVPCDDEYRPVICFTTNVTVDYNQLSSGGPVLTIQNNEVRVLAVAQTDERSVVGYPLFKHYKWIQKVLESK